MPIIPSFKYKSADTVTLVLVLEMGTEASPDSRITFVNVDVVIGAIIEEHGDHGDGDGGMGMMTTGIAMEMRMEMEMEMG